MTDTTIRQNVSNHPLNPAQVATILSQYANEADRILNNKDVYTVMQIARASAHLDDLLSTHQEGKSILETLMLKLDENIEEFRDWTQINPISFLDILTYGEIIHDQIQLIYTRGCSPVPKNRGGFLSLLRQ